MDIVMRSKSMIAITGVIPFMFFTIILLVRMWYIKLNPKTGKLIFELSLYRRIKNLCRILLV